MQLTVINVIITRASENIVTGALVLSNRLYLPISWQILLGFNKKHKQQL